MFFSCICFAELHYKENSIHIVEGIILTADCETSYDFIELGRGKNHSINDLAKMFDCGFTYIPERPGEARETLCDISEAKEKIGYEPKVNLEDYISEIKKV